MAYKAYRNLSKQQWSLLGHDDLVQLHLPAVYLMGVRFVVRPAGRERVLREHRKNVHAFVRGDSWGRPTRDEMPEPRSCEWVPVGYNPYKAGSFVRTDTGDPVTGAAMVYLTKSGKAFALGVY